MIRPHPPNETPADEPDHRGGGSDAWSSPWELDHEWADAPPPKTRPLAKEPAPKADVRAAVPAENDLETQHFAPPVRRQRGVSPERSWLTPIVLCLAMLLVVFVAGAGAAHLLDAAIKRRRTPRGSPAPA